MLRLQHVALPAMLLHYQQKKQSQPPAEEMSGKTPKDRGLTPSSSDSNSDSVNIGVVNVWDTEDNCNML